MLEDIIVLLCVVRLLDVDTDLLISLNVPLKNDVDQIYSNLTPVPVPDTVSSPGVIEEEDLGSSCIGRGCATLLKALKAKNVAILTSQPNITEMLCTEVSTYSKLICSMN